MQVVTVIALAETPARAAVTAAGLTSGSRCFLAQPSSMAFSRIVDFL
jgi:hypothetical protein